MALPGVKDSECQQAEAEDHKLLGPGDCISCKLWADSICEHPLTMASWDLGQFIAAKSVITWDQLLWGDAQLIMYCILVEYLRYWPDWTWAVHKNMAHLGYDTTVIPRATTVALWNSVLWNIMEPEHLGPGKCMRKRAHLGLCSSRTTGHLPLGRAGDVWLNWDWDFREHSGIWAA